MRYLTFITFLSSLLLLLFSCSHFENREYTDEEIAAESKKINVFFKEMFEEGIKRSPEAQTYLGRRDDYHLLDEKTSKKMKADLEFVKKNLKRLKKFNYYALDKNAQMSYRLFELDARNQLESFKYRDYWFSVNQMFGRHSGLPSFMMNMHRVEDVEDAKAYIARLKLFKVQFSELIESLENKRKLGIIAPKFVYPKAISDSENIIRGIPFDKSMHESPLYTDFRKKVENLKIEDSEKRELINEARMAMLDSVFPGYSSLIKKLHELEKVAPIEVGAWTLPDGENYYKMRLKMTTTTDMTPDEIHELGLKETERIHAEMEKIMKRVKFKGNFKDFLEFMKTSKKFRYANTQQGREQYVVDTNKIINNMRKELPKMFGILPKAHLVVKPVEPFREQSAGMAFYQGPSAVGDRPGIYYINLFDMNAVNKYEQEALAYHEAVPGHHMQISITKELENLPDFRKYGHGYTAYIEGWGLYAEYIPSEFGFYKDPYSNFGRLAMELWRAGRLVVDTGIHHKRWPMDKAVKWLDDNTPSTHDENVRAIQRYVVMPAQATAYMIGMKKILELKKYSERELGDKFDVRAFHDQVLNDGALPLSVLQEKIENWVKDLKV